MLHQPWLVRLCPELNVLQDRIAHLSLSQRDCTIYSVSRLLSDKYELRRGYEGASALGKSPDIGEDELVGYDVASHDFISVLSNCGHTDSIQKIMLARPWTKYLNKFHLFVTVEAALEYATASVSNVPEHAPFYVHRIGRRTTGGT